MNSHALNILEYDKIIETIKDMAVSELGKTLINEIHPSNDLDRIKTQLEEVNQAKLILNTTSSVPLQNLNGIDMILSKITKNSNLNPEDLSNVAMMLSGIRRLQSFMNERIDIAPMVTAYAASMYPLTEVIEEINVCIYNNRVDDKASSALEKIRKRIYIVEGRIKDKLDAFVKSNTYKKYLQDTTISIKNDRYVLSVKSEYKQQIQGSVVQKSSTGSTLFIEPAAVGQLQNELNMLKMDEEKEIYQILVYLTGLVAEYQQEIHLNIETLTFYDFLFAKAKYSRKINGHSCKLNHNNYTKILKGRHPLLGSDCVPLDFEIGNDYKALVITGPNTGGKTVVLKTVGLFTAMIQSGIHVPVEQGSEFAIYSDILVDIGDGQSIEQSLSTFSSHIKNIIGIMQKANPYTMVLLDEVGAGTDPMEGEGLAVAILEEMYNLGSTIISTSHYGQVKDFATKHKGFKNGMMRFDLSSLKPTYTLEIGKAGESNAFIIALRLGMAQKVIEEAHKITYDETMDYAHMKVERKPTAPEILYNKAKRPKSVKRQIEKKHQNDKEEIAFRVGDAVYVHSLNQRGIVFEEENNRKEIGVKVRDKKLYIAKKRLTIFIEREQLYPDHDHYDMDIVLESVDYRKKNKQMSRKFNKDMEIIHKEGNVELE